MKDHDQDEKLERNQIMKDAEVTSLTGSQRYGIWQGKTVRASDVNEFIKNQSLDWKKKPYYQSLLQVMMIY